MLTIHLKFIFDYVINIKICLWKFIKDDSKFISHLILSQKELNNKFEKELILNIRYKF